MIKKNMILRQLIAALFFGVVCIGLFAVSACSSSEETGATRNAEQPERIGPIVNEQQPPAGTAVQGPGMAGGDVQDGTVVDPRVQRNRDTVRAATERISRSQVQRLPLIKPPNAMYTVQVGAYKRAPNALALQKTLKTEHGEQPVFNLFTSTEGLYRVTIGKFETLGEATKYRNKIAQEQPKKYGTCWVTYIERSQ